MVMNIEERIRIARIIDKVERNKAFGKRIGIRITVESGKANLTRTAVRYDSK